MGLVSEDDGWRLPDVLWNELQGLLPPPKPHPLGCHRAPTDARVAMNAILLVLRTGMQWNALKAVGLCSSSAAHRWFQRWCQDGVFLGAWKRGLLQFDRRVGLDWAWLSMDAAMSKAPLGGDDTGPNPTDRGKSGTKRSVLTEAHGMPIGVVAAGANRNDFKLLAATVQSMAVPRPAPAAEQPQGMCLDKGYDYQEVRDLLAAFEFTGHIRARGEEARAIKQEAGFKARRWVVERTHSWMNRFRRILVRWEKKALNYLGMLHLALAIIVWRAVWRHQVPTDAAGLSG